MGEIKRKTDLLSYLPNYLKEYDELKAALEAENPEFEALWGETERALSNFFILTADEYGIGRFEKLLGIYPEPWLSLDERREIVLARWFSQLPYTYRALLALLRQLCGESFSVKREFENDYYLGIVTHIDNWVKALEVRRLLFKMIPANIRTEHDNTALTEMKNQSVIHCGAVTAKKKFSVYINAGMPNMRRHGANTRTFLGAKVAQKTKTHILTAGGA